MIRRCFPRALFVALISLLLAACEGELQIRLTDAPADDATAVNIEITGVELLTEAGAAETYEFDEARTINLTDLTGGRTVTLVSDDDTPGGTYTGVRLLINAAAGKATIVWKWRFTAWQPGHFSTVTLEFTKKDDGSTDLELNQVGVPEEERERTEQGWKGLLFDRLKAMLGGSVMG